MEVSISVFSGCEMKMERQCISCCDDGLFSRKLTEIVSRYPRNQVFLLCDTNSRKCCLDLLPLDTYRLPVLEIPAGESSKSLESLQHIWSFLLNHNASRSSLLLNLGGGMICDLGGFAASIFMRGMDFVHLPTTLLAMVDASLGGKNGIDFEGLKNVIGCINLPKETLIWPKFLLTLSDREKLSGYAEMMKHALLDSQSAWERISAFDPSSTWEEAMMPDLLQESSSIKCRFVQNDLHDYGQRQALNFGHTVGHALESLSISQPAYGNEQPLPHGYAVAYGIICELYLSTKTAGFPREHLMQVLYHIKERYPSYSISCKDYPLLLEEMRHDKKNGGSSIRMTLLSDFGQIHTGQEPGEKLIEESLDFFQEFMS